MAKLFPAMWWSSRDRQFRTWWRFCTKPATARSTLSDAASGSTTHAISPPLTQFFGNFLANIRRLAPASSPAWWSTAKLRSIALLTRRRSPADNSELQKKCALDERRLSEAFQPRPCQRVRAGVMPLVVELRRVEQSSLGNLIPKKLLDSRVRARL